MTDNEQYRDPADIRHHIGATGSFSLSNVSGDIRLRGGDTDEAHVVARAHGDEEWLPITVRRSEGMLSIEVDQKSSLFGWFGRGRDVEFDVVLPRGARVDVNGVSAELDVTDLVGDQTYHTVSGDVSILRAGGRISLTTVSGDAELRAVEPVEAQVTSTSGDIEAEAPLFRASKVRTVSGDVELRGAFDTGALHSIETVSGDVDVESSSGLTVEVRKGIDLGGGPKQRVVGDGAARLRFRSLSGDLHVMGAGADKGVKNSRFSQFSPPAPPVPPVPPEPQLRPTPPADTRPSSLEILQALERGEIDVDEAARRLEGANSRG